MNTFKLLVVIYIMVVASLVYAFDDFNQPVPDILATPPTAKPQPVKPSTGRRPAARPRRRVQGESLLSYPRPGDEQRPLYSNPTRDPAGEDKPPAPAGAGSN